MSDDKDRNNDAEPESGDQEAGQPPADPQPAPAATPRRASPVGWFALLLVIVLAAAAAWVVTEAQRREASLLERLQALETVTEREVLDASEQQAQIRAYGRELEQSLQDDLRRRLAALRPELEQTQAGLEGLEQQLRAVEGQVEGVATQLEGQAETLARFGTRDRDSWLLAEVEYLLRLANQRLVMTGDAESARALLRSADTVLRELDDASLFPARRAVAADLAALRALPQVDVEGLYLRLSALAESASELVIFELPDAAQATAEAPAEDWQGRLRQGWQAALDKLSSYIIIRRRDVPMQTLMDPQWEGLVRQNLRMLLEQSQVALLSGNAELYRESLARARRWLQEFFESDGEAARAMDAELEALAAAPVEVKLPDLSRSLDALDAAADTREGGG